MFIIIKNFNNYFNCLKYECDCLYLAVGRLQANSFLIGFLSAFYINKFPFPFLFFINSYEIFTYVYFILEVTFIDLFNSYLKIFFVFSLFYIYSLTVILSYLCLF